PLRVPQIAMPLSVSMTVAAARGPNRNAAQTSTGNVKKAIGTCWAESEAMPPNITTPVVTAETATSAATASRSAANGKRLVAQSTTAGAASRAPAAAPSHQVSQSGPTAGAAATPAGPR